MRKVNTYGNYEEGCTSFVGSGGECFTNDHLFAWCGIWPFEVYESSRELSRDERAGLHMLDEKAGEGEGRVQRRVIRRSLVVPVLLM